MLSLDTIMPYVGLGLLVFVGLLTLIGLLKGRSRGFLRQLIRTITIVISAVASFFLTRLAFNLISDYVAGKSASDLITMLEGYGISLGDFKNVLLSYDAESINHVLAVPLSLIILPILFVLSFIILNIILHIVHAIICKLLYLSKWRNNFFTRLLGMLLCAAQGFAVAILCLVPVIGITSTFSTAVKDIKAQDPTSAATADITTTYNEYIKPIADDPYVAMIGQFGANTVYEMLTTVKVNDAEHNMSKEIITPALKTFGAVKVLGDLDWQHLTNNSKDAINSLIGVAKESPYMATLVSDLLDSIASAYSSGSMGEDDELVSEFINALLGVFVDIDEESLVPTLEVIRDVFFMLSDERVLVQLSGDAALLSDILTRKDDNGDTLITRVTAKLNSNVRTEPLVGTLSKISITVMAHSFNGIEGIEINEQTYENVKIGVNNILSIEKESYATEEEYVSAISDSLNETFTENGIALDAPIVDEMAQYVADNYSEANELSDAEVNDIILSYYNAYLESGELPTTPPVLN